MARQDMDCHLRKIDELASEINHNVPEDKIAAQAFRADLAGLLVVTIAASYEACVKEVLVNYAAKQHVAFGNFAQNNYKKINSRVKVKDLLGYAKLFGDNVDKRFKERLAIKKKRISDRLGINIENRFEQILDWRHDFAHAWVNNTTIEEALKTHRFGKRVLYAFDEAFNAP